jgi:hypothetical protein
VVFVFVSLMSLSRSGERERVGDEVLSISEETNGVLERVKDENTRTPLPKLQLTIIMMVQLAEPVTSSVVYPFIPQLVRETGVTGGDERRTGYYAGIIVRQ